MRTAAHSCLMSRKSLGGARTTAARTQLNESADAEEASDASALPSPALALDAADELRHRRHLRPPLCPAAFSGAFRATSDLIHFPDAPIGAAQCEMRLLTPSARPKLPLGCVGALGTWDVEEEKPRRGETGRDKMEGEAASEVVGVVEEVAVVLFGHDGGEGQTNRSSIV